MQLNVSRFQIECLEPLKAQVRAGPPSSVVRSVDTPDTSPSNAGTLSSSTLRRRWLWTSTAPALTQTVTPRSRPSGGTSWRRRLKRRTDRNTKRARRRNIGERGAARGRGQDPETDIGDNQRAQTQTVSGRGAGRGREGKRRKNTRRRKRANIRYL